jgi:hypothetical protein
MVRRMRAGTILAGAAALLLAAGACGPIEDEPAAADDPLRSVTPNTAIALPSPEPPEIVGPFRLVSAGWVDARTPAPTFGPDGDATVVRVEYTEDLAVVRTAPYYREPSYLPAGYTLGRAFGSVLGSEVLTYTLEFAGPRGYWVSVTRRRFTAPHDIQRPLPVGVGTNDLVLSTILGLPAALSPLRPDVEAGGASITVAHEDTLTIVEGFTVTGSSPDFEELIRVAESVLR